MLNYSVAYANTNIDEAIDALKSINEFKALTILNGQNYTKSTIPVNVVEEYNLPYELSKALAFTNVDGDKLSIYVNSKVMNSSPEAVACLIAHETIHINPGVDSIAEEIQAWTYEAIIWKKFITKNPNLINNPDELTRRLNKMVNASSDELKNMITSKELYSGLK